MLLSILFPLWGQVLLTTSTAKYTQECMQCLHINEREIKEMILKSCGSQDCKYVWNKKWAVKMLSCARQRKGGFIRLGEWEGVERCEKWISSSMKQQCVHVGKELFLLSDRGALKEDSWVSEKCHNQQESALSWLTVCIQHEGPVMATLTWLGTSGGSINPPFLPFSVYRVQHSYAGICP